VWGVEEWVGEYVFGLGGEGFVEGCDDFVGVVG